MRPTPDLICSGSDLTSLEMTTVDSFVKILSQSPNVKIHSPGPQKSPLVGR